MDGQAELDRVADYVLRWFIYLQFIPIPVVTGYDVEQLL